MSARRHPAAYLVHSILGFQLSLFVTFICLTGTLAVVADDLEWLYRPEVRATRGERVSWQAQVEAARAAFPDSTIDYANIGEEPYLATRFTTTAPSGETRVVYVDPGTGRVLGESSWLTLQSFLRALHSYLFAPGDWGFYLVTALGFVVTGSLVSGLLVYKKFWRGFFRRPRSTKKKRVLWGDLHRLASVWSTWFVLVIAVTSVWYFVERLMYRAGLDLDRPRTMIESTALDGLGPEPPAPRPLNELIAFAQSHIPDLEVREIWFPARLEESLALVGQADAYLVRDRSNGVELNPYTGEVLGVHRASSLSAMERWTHTADPLHFGDFGGIGTKIVWFVFGLLMCASAVTGAFVHANRTIQAAAILRDSTGSSVRRRTRMKLSPAWILANGALVLAIPVLSFAGYWGPSLSPEIPTTTLGPSVVGEWQMSASSTDPIEPGAPMHWNVHFCRGCHGRIRSASIGFGTGDAPPAEMVAVLGTANAASAELLVPQVEENKPVHLWLSVRGWDGRDHRLSWPLQD